jgi:DNA-binding GntR family transcriptional regulator
MKRVDRHDRSAGIGRPTKQDLVYATLKRGILSGLYGPGYRIVIDAVARELEVSALPVREAIRRLEAEGWLTFEPNVGARVTPLEPGQFEHTLYTLALLEGAATALSARHLTAVDIRQARELNAEMREAAKEGNALLYSRLNTEFHQLLTERCDNGYLLGLTRQTSERLTALRRSAFLLAPARALEEHEHLLGLIENQAAEPDIETAARQHRMHTLALFQRMIARAGERLPAALSGTEIAIEAAGDPPPTAGPGH